MFKTVLLDLDGPLLDGKYRHFKCYQDILVQYGFEPMPIEAYWQMKRERQDRHKQLAVSGAGSIYPEFLEYWMQHIEEKDYLVLDQLQPKALAVLEAWKSKKIEVILVTMRNEKDNLISQLDSVGLLPFLDHVVAVGTSKGVKGKASAASEFIDLNDKESVLWVGDTETDIWAARELGVKVCAVECGLRSSEYLVSLGPDYLVSDLVALNALEGFLL